MALSGLLDVQLSVPDPGQLEAFWVRRGMTVSGTGVLGTAERPCQLRLREGSYRHVSEIRLACDQESDLAAIATRLEGLGIASRAGDGWLRCPDPILDHDVVIEVGAANPLSRPAVRAFNRPGQSERLGRRSTACLEKAPHSPRRLGHVVFGTTDVERSRAFYVDGLGFKVSDALPGFAYFLRCSSDHHNLLVAPSAVPCLNHYAMEMDDMDAIGLAGNQVIEERPDCSVTGVGRHVIGANLFWYLLDPAGGMFELFADMDQIVDDERWAAEVFQDRWDDFKIAAWNSTEIKADFFEPADIDVIAKGREAAGR